MRLMKFLTFLWLLLCVTVQAQVLEAPELVPTYVNIPVDIGGFSIPRLT